MDAVNAEQARVVNFEKFKGLVQKLGKFDLPDIPVIPFKVTPAHPPTQPHTYTHIHKIQQPALKSTPTPTPTPRWKAPSGTSPTTPCWESSCT